MTDDDCNLLERAARAAGYTPVRLTDDNTALLLEGVQRPWNSLHENPHSDGMGDALRLAAKLCMQIQCSRGYQHVSVYGRDFTIIESSDGGDACTSVRRAITRAAAEMAP